jgi:hypothetical protein
MAIFFNFALKLCSFSASTIFLVYNIPLEIALKKRYKHGQKASLAECSLMLKIFLFYRVLPAINEFFLELA